MMHLTHHRHSFFYARRNAPKARNREAFDMHFGVERYAYDWHRQPETADVDIGNRWELREENRPTRHRLFSKA